MRDTTNASSAYAVCLVSYQPGTVLSRGRVFHHAVRARAAASCLCSFVIALEMTGSEFTNANV